MEAEAVVTMQVLSLSIVFLVLSVLGRRALQNSVAIQHSFCKKDISHSAEPTATPTHTEHIQ